MGRVIMTWGDTEYFMGTIYYISYNLEWGEFIDYDKFWIGQIHNSAYNNMGHGYFSTIFGI